MIIWRKKEIFAYPENMNYCDVASNNITSIRVNLSTLHSPNLASMHYFALYYKLFSEVL